MANTLNRLVTTHRVRTLLECYGANPAAWPDEERQAARLLLERNHELLSLQDEATQLDALIQAYGQSRKADPQQMAFLTKQIMRDLPEPSAARSAHRRSLGWLVGLAASLAMVSMLFFATQSALPPDTVPSPLAQVDTTSEIFYDWAWEDVTGEDDASESSDSDIFPLYALVAEELTGRAIPADIE